MTYALLQWPWRGKFKSMQGGEGWKHTPEVQADTTASAALQSPQHP